MFVCCECRSTICTTQDDELTSRPSARASQPAERLTRHVGATTMRASSISSLA